LRPAGSLKAKDVFGGAHGAVSQLRGLQSWFESQQSMVFFAASVLVIYEGEAKCVS
jgi:1D-myo-inositol-tetrakisphosphate 5-kinase/inositol-polyphosphate multikinase